jgi:NADH-quinone oxidoreductase subunit H
MRLGWKVLIPFSLVWILVVAAFRELTNEGKSRMVTLAYVGIPIVVLVLAWAFISDAKARRLAADEDARLEAAEVAQRDTYPIPILTGAPSVDIPAVAATTTDSTEVLDV